MFNDFYGENAFGISKNLIYRSIFNAGLRNKCTNIFVQYSFYHLLTSSPTKKKLRRKSKNDVKNSREGG